MREAIQERGRHLCISEDGLAGPKLHIWAFGGTNSVHFMPPTAPNTLPRFRLAS